MLQVEASQSRPSSRATANTAGMSKIDVRRLQMLARQRQKLEEEAAQLQAEVDAMVSTRMTSVAVAVCSIVPLGTCRYEEMISIPLQERSPTFRLLYSTASVLLACLLFTFAFTPSAILQ